MKNHKKKKSRLKFQYYTLTRIGFISFFICILLSSVTKISFWENDNSKILEIETKIEEIAEIEEVIDDEPEENLINEPDNKNDIYWQYKNVSLINVDIKKLKKENSDTIGWIQVLGTNINYPIVQSNDNDYYLKRDFNKEKNSGGWIFLDYRNNIDDLSKNNIIYGHRRYNQTMFGTLKKVLTEDWQQNTDNHIIKISTEKYNYLFQVFSVYEIPNETYYLQSDFANAETYSDFLNTISKRSIYNFNTEVNSDTIILTLSTCHNKDDRLVVHSKLIKANPKN